ncbi:hypothetical protein FFLO_04901 [Filobasidium floriforme]|uniref:Serine aminopeptidase S33 domain-containing protein n=1 Tax=Filobasidium floriforme TaxID=5210 RepID=A0A8K0JHW5_9TREE|nr:hypothetical protein FFLO_04901 [Filobasidium floriforme]
MPSVVWDLIEPGLQKFKLYTPPDPTYGRYLTKPWAPEQALDNDPTIRTRRRRVFLHGRAAPDSVDIEFAEDITLVPEELSKERIRGGRWVYYKSWEMKEESLTSKEGLGVDILLVHGLNEYGRVADARYAPHCRYFLEKGFRVIVPDLPSYGRSTGIHSNLTDVHLLTAAVYVVAKDLIEVDIADGREQREVFLTGASMGGWTVLYYIITYPPTSDVEKIISSGSGSGVGDQPAEPKKEYRPKIAGAMVLCPLVEVAADSRPNALVELAAKALVKVAASLPMAEAVRGKVSDDPRVEREFGEDPLTYHGKLRASTGLSLLHGFTELQKKAEMIKLPIRMIHGDKDRATSHLATKAFYERISSPEKEIKIYEGYEHVMTKVGIDEADDAKRQAVIEDWVGWMCKRATMDREKAGSA